MIPASIISKLVRLGLTDDQIDAVAGLMEEVADAVEAKAGAAIASRRLADRERKQRQRGGTGSRDFTGRHVTSWDKRDLSPPPAPSPEPPTPPAPTHVTPQPSAVAPKAAKRSRIAEDAQPDDRDRAAAESAGMDAQTFRFEWGRFRDHHRAEGSLMADWHAAWRKWTTSPFRKPMSGQGARAGPFDRGNSIDAANNVLRRMSQADVQRHDPPDEPAYGAPALAFARR